MKKNTSSRKSLEREGKEVRFIFHWSCDIHEVQRRMPGATALSYMTGTPAMILAKMLGKRKIKAIGVIPPECLEPEVIEAFFTELAEKGIIIHERVEGRLG